MAGREGENEPTAVDQRTQWNILFGSFADNLGSVGTIPMCLSPLMFTMFYSDFVVQGASPIMSQQAHKWIYTLVAVVAVPGALIAPFLSSKFGPAASCVGANVVAGAVTVALLYIAHADPSTTTFSIFVAALYAGFPLTLVSQFFTSPMLERQVLVVCCIGQLDRETLD